ncbi:hypothetical protein, partial [uncultured Legionella sp.]|uniref:hypothetical protein n=1 Tax=uncultured Legionella sp. TaxID=210934 RepID=UPI00261A2698
MPKPYLLKNIKGFTAHSGNTNTGHVVHQVEYRDDDEASISIFFKENKKNNPDSSVKEVAFSELARLFMLPHSTPKYHLVRNEQNQIAGVASHNINLSITQQIDIHTAPFKKIHYVTATNTYEFNDVTVTNSDDIPYQFLNKLPHGFFAHLMAEKNKGALTIDMESLASTFAGKYTLEEDDLHKGNLGIYTVIKDNKPHIVFFNIDHDLMLSDSIMSFLDMRVSNWAYGEKAFNITATDLINFPDLQNSANHYWPTHKRFMVHYNDEKAFISEEERAAFAGLKNDSEFNRYKWKRFLKCMMIPNQLLEASLALHLDRNKAKDVAEINLITQALNERTMKLRTVLLSIPEFRTYLVSGYGQEDIAGIKQEFSEYIAESLEDQHELTDNLHNEINRKSAIYVSLCTQENLFRIQDGDTPLHISIKLGEYRFDESQKAFSNNLQTENLHTKKLPIDIAAEMALSYEIGSEKTNPGKDPFSIIGHLLSQGAKMTPLVVNVLESKGINIKTYQFQSQYYERDVTNYPELKALIAEIGRDPNLSLK